MGLRIVLLGAPGAGKGTQAKRIAEAHGIPHISTGDIFRDNLKRGTELGTKVKAYMDQGALVPDEVTCEVVQDRLNAPDCAEGYVLDGFPRSVPQAEMLDAYLAGRDQRLSVVLDVDVPDEDIVNRLTARRTCEKCGAIYNMLYNPPSDGETCDREGCGGQVVQRDDDKEETVRNRLDVYHETTEPLLDYYKKQALLRSVPGSGLPPDAVFAKIEEVLKTVTDA